MSTEFQLETFPPIRRATIDLLAASSRKHMIHGLIEIDITRTRQTLRAMRVDTGTVISLSSYIIFCVSRTVAEDLHLQAYRGLWNRLYLFEHVDVATPVERTIDGRNEVLPAIIRSAEKKTLLEIQEEITRAQTGILGKSSVFKLMNWYVLLPRFIRRSFFSILDLFPRLMKQNGGTVMVSSLNMFGAGTGWGVPIASHTLNLTLGGMTRKPVLNGNALENHEYLCVTVSIDHDLVDGAPAARFIQAFKRRVEKGEGLTPG